MNEDYQKTCTFAPNLNNNTDKKNRRKFDEFINDQEEYQRKIANKLNDVK